MRRFERFTGVTVLPSVKQYLTVLVAVAMMGLAGCAKNSDIRLTASPENPAAQGIAKVKITDNGNTEIDLVVKHLAPPEKISSGATTYVVWVLGTEPFARHQNMGALVVDKNLDGKFKGVTPLRAFQLLVTAEPSAVSTSPNGKTALSAPIQMR